MIRWSRHAQNDLQRLHAFVAAGDSSQATRTVGALVAAVGKLAEFPRLGARLPEFGKREVRRLIVGDYEIRYELRRDQLFVVRLWHVREDR